MATYQRWSCCISKLSPSSIGLHLEDKNSPNGTRTSNKQACKSSNSISLCTKPIVDDPTAKNHMEATLNEPTQT